MHFAKVIVIAVCCSVLQCVAVCCSVLQYVNFDKRDVSNSIDQYEHYNPNDFDIFVN